MKKKLYDYLDYIDKLISEKSSETDFEKVQKEHLIQINFFQHERLIHLIVTALFAVSTIICICFTLFFLRIIVLDITLLCLLIPYIFHYYRLENGVQKMYDQYEVIQKLLDEKQI